MSQIASPLTHPQISGTPISQESFVDPGLSERVDQAIKAYETKSTLETAETLQKIIEECPFLQDIQLSRACLLKILKVRDDAVQLSALRALRELLIPQTLLFDIQNAQLSEFADLEACIREVLIEKVSLSPNQETLEHFLDLYGDVIERVGLLSYQREDGGDFVPIIQKNAQAVENSLLQLSIPSKIHYLATFQKMVQLFTKERDDAEKIRRLKEAFEFCHDPYKYFLIGDFFQTHQMYTRCHTHFEKNLQILTERHKGQTAPDLLEWEKKAYLKLGNMWHMLGKHSSAILCYEQMLIRAKQLGDGEWEKTANYSLGKEFTSLCDYPNAIQCHERVFLGSGDVETSLVDGQAFVGLGICYRQQGLYEDAKNSLNQGLSIIDQSKYDSADYIADTRANVHMVMGSLYKHLGDWSNAIKEHTKALKYADNQNTQAIIKMNLGNAYMDKGRASGNKGDLESAVERLSEAKNLALHPYNRGQALMNLGTALLDLEKYDGDEGAVSCFTKALELIKGNKNLECIICTHLVIIYREQKKYTEAEDICKRALKLTAELGDKLLEASVYCNFGMLLREQGKASEAIEILRRSADAFATLQESVGDSSKEKITIFENQAETYMVLERLLIEQKELLKALEVTDERRARALVSTLLKKQSSTVKSLTSVEMQAVAKQQNSTLLIYSMAPLNLRKDALLEIEVWIVPPEGNISFGTLSALSIEKEIRDQKVLFEGFPFFRESRGSVESESLPYLQEMEELSRGDRDGIKERVLGRFKTKLENWYKTLIQPIEKGLPQTPGQTVTIVAEGYLSQLPFAAFRDEKGDYLIEKYAISYAPSIQALKLLSQPREKFCTDSLIVGNPDTLNAKDELKLAEKEAHIIGGLLQLPSDKLMLKKTATPSRVLEEMQKSQWIHLACHGCTGESLDLSSTSEKIDIDSVFQGYLKLSPDNEHLNGYLYAQEIVKLNLKANLVFLSSCYSGTGKLQREGVIGFSWALLSAGASSVIGSYWMVPESELTVEMVQTFYTTLIDGGGKISKAEALRKAMLKVIEKEKESPHLWASFLLTGSES